MGRVKISVISVIIMVAVLAAGAGCANLPQTDAPSGGTVTPGQRVYQSVANANNQASELAFAFDSMNMNPAGSTVSHNQRAGNLPARANSEADAEPEIAEPATTVDSACELTDEEILGTVPELTTEGDSGNAAGQSEKVTQPANDNVNIAQAYKLMETYAAMGTVCNDKYVKASELLQQDWDAQYKVVRDEYNNFHDMVELAKNSAEEYFAVQRNLTNDIKNVELQQEQRRNDLREIELFEEWKGQADNTVLAAYRLMDDIEDMRIVIQKAALSAHFAALNKQALILPESLTALHSQLGLFHDRSQEIRQAFGGPPEDSQIN